MGHPFSVRSGLHADPNIRVPLRSPVFLLFLDSVWQVQRQYPCAFEFNETFLIMLFDHSQSSPYGMSYPSDHLVLARP